WDFFSRKASVRECLPIACVLTIPAAGSEASASCVISNDALRLKRGTSSDAFRPRLAIMDPRLTFTLPQYQTAAGVTDIICHICERFFSSAGAVPVTDNIACGIIRAVMDAATAVTEKPDDYDARATIMWSGTLAHNDLCGCGRAAAAGKRAGGWESHGLEHEISAHHPEVAHGAGLAVILPAWMRYVWHADPTRFLAFAKGVFDVEPMDKTDEGTQDAVTYAIDELQRFFVGLGMPRALADLGLSPADVDAWLGTLRQNKGERFGELMPLTMDDARAIYLSAF
ncbi:iron-containing alcohol dehydrogenase, partial [Olsenella uli]